MHQVKITMDGQQIEVSDNSTILDVAKKLGKDIPTLCHHESLNMIDGASCRMCLVDVEGMRNLVPSCTMPVNDGMVIHTNNEKVIQARKTVLELLISKHPLDCMTCDKAGDCKLQDYCFKYDVKDSSYNNEKIFNKKLDQSNEFYYYDPNKCILCGKCVRVCSQLQGVGAIGLSERGYDTHVAVPFEQRITDSTCVSCGNCVSQCPVGALVPKRKEKFRNWEVTKTKTTCAYCGVGCQMELWVKDNKVVEVKPRMAEANSELLCVKGKFGHGFINHPDRLKSPLIKKDGKFVEATWSEAISLIADRINKVKKEYGSDTIAGFSSARCTNEENYLFQKMMRAVIGTNNVDHCARLCHASTVAGLATTLGSGAMTNSIKEVLNSDVIFVSGSNTTETHPVIGAHIKRAKANGAKLIVAEPREIDLAKHADLFLQIKPGTNVALYNGLMHVIIKENLHDKEYIESKTENYDALEALVADYTPEKVGEICGVKPESIRKAAMLYSKGEKASFYYSMGVTQHSTGTQGVMSVSNLALLCGNIGKESAGVNPLRGQNNVQGACDLGALPGDFPGYQKVANPDIVSKFEKAWDSKLSNKVGLTVTEVMKEGEKGNLKLLYVMGENPVISDPDTNHVIKALEKIDFVVVQDIFLSETAQYADVILPAASFAEKDGTFTNTERRVQRVRKAIDPVGDSKPDWEILMTVMNALGYGKQYNHPSEIMEEMASLTPQYGGITYDRIEEEGLQWPCPTKEHPGTKFLHQEKIARGKGLFKPADYIESAESPDGDYPYLLTTGRMLYHFHTKTMTGRVEGLNKLYPHSYIEINPTTANRLGFQEGDKAKVTSRRGDITTTVKITNIVDEDIVFMPFHFSDGAVNYLTNNVVDPIAKIPEFKVSAVRIEKV
ncbi:MAG: formate dehydrogenase subunit alpha [Eubacteriales bacterium]